MLNRRRMIQTMAAATGCVLSEVTGCGGGGKASTQPVTPTPPYLPVGKFSPSAAYLAFLDDLERQGSLYFWGQAMQMVGFH